MTADCPFCEYEGATRQVEAHISGRSDENHRGRVGADWRATIANSHGNDESEGNATSTALLFAMILFFVMIAAQSWLDTDAKITDSEEESTGEVGMLARP